MTIAELDITSEAVREDPYTVYRRLREHDPVHWSPLLRTWFFTRYVDVEELLRDHATFSNDRSGAADWTPPPGEFRFNMLRQDPPEHARLRALVSHAFTARIVGALRPRVTSIVTELLDAAVVRGELDAITDLAVPLPARVVTALLGVPATEWPRFARWSSTFMLMAEPPAVWRGRWAEIIAARDESLAYWRGEAAKRRACPTEDLITALVAARERVEMDDLEFAAMCDLLLVAGHETTMNLIGNGIAALLAHAEQLERLRADPALTASAVEELLRFDAPLQFDYRVITSDLEVHGRTLRRGDQVAAVLGSANRDGDRFAYPDSLDLARDPNPHLSFGRGIHFCVGAPLARLEAQIAIGAVVERFPRMRQPRAATRRTGFNLRGYSSLPLVVSG